MLDVLPEDANFDSTLIQRLEKWMGESSEFIRKALPTFESPSQCHAWDAVKTKYGLNVPFEEFLADAQSIV